MTHYHARGVSTGITMEGARVIADSIAAALRERDERLQVLEAAARRNKGTTEELITMTDRLMRRQHELAARQDQTRTSTPIDRTLARADSCLRG